MIDFCVSSLPKYEDFSNVKFAGYKFEKILSMMNEVFGIYCDRRDLFEQQKVINIQEYNENNQNNPLPYIVLAVDEASGFMTQFSTEQFEQIDSLMKDLLRMAGNMECLQSMQLKEYKPLTTQYHGVVECLG